MSLPHMSLGDLSVPIPVIQGGMGIGISMARLAAAVADEGGIGVVAGAMIGMREPDVAKNPVEATTRALRNELQKARAATSGIIGVNIMVALTTFADQVKTSIEEHADVILSGAGLPMDLPGIFRETCEKAGRRFRTKLIPIVSSARATALIARKWMQKYDYTPDAFVVEGPMAGGHLGFSRENLVDPDYKLELLLPRILEALKPFEDKSGQKIPVIAAGGIFSGADIGRFLEMGASGVQMGTRFVATRECDVDERFKEAYVNAKREDVTIIDSPAGMPGRVLHNKFIDFIRSGVRKNFRCPFHCVKTCEGEINTYCISTALINAMKGNMDQGVTFCGENVYKVDGIYSVHDLFRMLREEYDAWQSQRG